MGVSASAVFCLDADGFHWFESPEAAAGFLKPIAVSDPAYFCFDTAGHRLEPVVIGSGSAERVVLLRTDDMISDQQVRQLASFVDLALPGKARGRGFHDFVAAVVGHSRPSR